MTTAKRMKALLEDNSISGIVVDGPDRVYVEREDKLEDTDLCFSSAEEVVGWANSLLAARGWPPVGSARPWTEVQLGDGIRLIVVLPPVAASGPTVVIEKLWRDPITLDALLQWGSLDRSIADFLQVVMQARLNVLVSGGTSSGKSHLASLIAEWMPDTDRLVVVGQADFCRPIRHERQVSLHTRPADPSGSGEVTVRDLLKIAARIRPGRIMVSELEGDEALEVIKLMNWGHDGTMTILHAESPRDVLARLETMMMVAEPTLTLPVIRGQIASALDLIVHIQRLEDGRRKIVSIAEVQDLRGDSIVLQELFSWVQTGVAEDGRLMGDFTATGAAPSFAPTLAASGLVFPEGMFEV